MLSAAKRALHSRLAWVVAGALVLVGGASGAAVWSSSSIPGSSGVSTAATRSRTATCGWSPRRAAASRARRRSTGTRRARPGRPAQPGPRGRRAAGATGPAGAAGATGPAGLTGPSDAFIARADDTPLTPTRQPVATLTNLPAGSYVIMASLRGSNSDGDYARYYCDVVSPNALTQTISDLPPLHADGQTGTAGMALTAPTPSPPRTRRSTSRSSAPRSSAERS